MRTRDSRVSRRGIAAALAVLVALAAASAPAQDAPPGKPKELRVSTAVGPAFALGKAGERWAKLVAEKSAGRMAATLHPGATLAYRDPAREFLALRDGGADLAVGSSLYWAAQVKALGVVGLPWLAPEPKQLEALAGGDVGAALTAALEGAGVVPLALAPLGYRELATWTRAVTAPADVAGLKVRVATAPPLAALFTGLGAQAAAVAFASAQPAFLSGALDAQEGPVAVFASTRIYALGAKHVTLWNAVGELAVFAVNRAVWDGATEADRAVLREAAQQAAKELPELARQETAAALAELRQRGLAVVQLTPAGHMAFAAASRGVYDEGAAAAGSEVARLAEAAVKAAGP
jgi:TRAP-type C4-dicarboxylate transport system substrate-binding protein